MTISELQVPTPELGLEKAQDADDTADYLVTGLANSLTTLDSLFSSTSGHTHAGVHQGGPISSIPASAIPDGSITSAKITDGAIQTVDLADGSVTSAKIADGTIQSADIAASITLTTPTLTTPTINNATEASPTISNPSINGTIGGSATFTNGPFTNDWVRCNTATYGLFNAVAACGIGFDAAGPTIYGAYGGGHLISETAAQTLTNKTLNASTLNSPTLNTPTVSSPSLSGTVSGTPTWASPQSFPAGEKVGGSLSLANANPASTDWKVQSGQTFAGSIANGSITQVAVGFTGFSAAPNVVATLNNVSGGGGTPNIYISEVTGISAGGCNVSIYNNSGGGQSATINWIAVGH